MRREYKNVAEEQFCKWAEDKGYYPIKKGWPDFFCRNRDGSYIAVEVKPSKTDKLKVEQLLVMAQLVEHGFPCFLWDAESKELQPVTKASELKSLIFRGNGDPTTHQP